MTDMYEFYLVVAPGFEDILSSELESWLPGVKNQDPLKQERGGVTIQTSLASGVELNRLLKTPSRILLRVDEFPCRDVQKLFRKISSFDWQDWLGADLAVDFQVSSQGSRLRMKKKIEEACVDGYAAHLKKRDRKPAVKPDPDITIFVRLKDDVCTVSLDTTGELLHKRGVKPLVSDAPLRETLAAALLLSLEKSAPSFGGDIELVDPMTGGGTFLLEAALLRKPVTSRKFAFESMKPWRTGKKERAQLRKSSRSNFVSLIGFDLDQKALAAASENLKGLSDGAAIDLRNEDFIKAKPLAPCSAGRQRWLIVNPPYGERIKVKGKLADFYSELVQAANRVANPDRACFLFPTKVPFEKVKWPSEWRILARKKFKNGGLDIEAFFVGKMNHWTLGR
jgi:putative N6-adenine-specific DNA methylase